MRAVIRACLALACLALGSTVANAQPPATEPEDPATLEARALFDRGRELATEQRFSEAADAFARSLALSDRPSTASNLGACLRALGRHADAIAMFEHYLADADPALDADGIADAERMLRASRAAVSEVTIEVLPADARVTLDGAPLEGGTTRSARVDAGTHVVRAEAEDHAPLLIEITTRRGEPLRRALHLEPTERPAALTIAADVPEAAIRIDGREVGRGNAELTLPAGSYSLSIQAPGSTPITRSIELAWNDRLRVDMALARPDRSLADEPAFWLALIGGAAAIAVAVVVGVLVGTSDPVSGGSTGIVLSPGARGFAL